jgi:hypothetical protein
LCGPCVGLVLNGGTLSAVGLVVNGELVAVTLNGHGAITDVVVSHLSSVGAVNRNLLVVGAKSVTVGIGVVQETSLQHLVHAGFNTRDQVGGGESNLLSLGVVVSRVPVKGNFTNGDQGVV